MKRRQVVLVPGLWMPAATMGFLSLRLQRAGTKCTFSPTTGALRMKPTSRRSRASPGQDRLRRPQPRRRSRPRHAEPPPRGRRRGRRAAGCARARLPRRPQIRRREARPMDDGRVPLAVGGTCGALGSRCTAGRDRRHPSLWAGRALCALPGPNDGVVRVEETSVDGMVGQALVRQATACWSCRARSGSSSSGSSPADVSHENLDSDPGARRRRGMPVARLLHAGGRRALRRAVESAAGLGLASPTRRRRRSSGRASRRRDTSVSSPRRAWACRTTAAICPTRASTALTWYGTYSPHPSYRWSRSSSAFLRRLRELPRLLF